MTVGLLNIHDDKTVRTAGINRLFVINCSLAYAAVDTHIKYLRFGLLVVGCEMETIFGRTF